MRRYVLKKVAYAEISQRAMNEYENIIDAFTADGMNYKSDELGTFDNREKALEELGKYRCTAKAMTSYGVLVSINECMKPKYYEANMIYLEAQEYNEDWEDWESTGEYDFAEMDEN